MLKLMQGDCLELMQDIPDKSVDLVLTDPPYGTTACKWDSVIPFEPMWNHLCRILKKGGAVALFGSEPFSSALRMSNIEAYKYDWVWDRMQGSGFLNSKKRPLTSYENIMLFSNVKLGRFTYNPQLTDKEAEKIRPISKRTPSSASTYGATNGFLSNDYDKTKSFPRDVIRQSSRQGECNSINRVHPTQKPVVLLEYIIRTYTRDGDTVLDFTMGSGSTGVACVNTNRNFIGIELDADYFKIAENRIADAQNK